jgi:hypothetical protein
MKWNLMTPTNYSIAESNWTQNFYLYFDEENALYKIVRSKARKKGLFNLSTFL